MAKMMDVTFVATLPYTRSFLAKRLMLGILSLQMDLKKGIAMLGGLCGKYLRVALKLKAVSGQKPPISCSPQSYSWKDMNSAKLGSRFFPNQACR